MIPVIEILKDIRKWPNNFNDIVKENQKRNKLCDYHTIKMCLFSNYIVSKNISFIDLLKKTSYKYMTKRICKKSFNKKCGNPKKMNTNNIFHLALRIYTYIEIFVTYKNNSQELLDSLKNFASNKEDFELLCNHVFELNNNCLKFCEYKDNILKKENEDDILEIQSKDIKIDENISKHIKDRLFDNIDSSNDKTIKIKKVKSLLNNITGKLKENKLSDVQEQELEKSLIELKSKLKNNKLSEENELDTFLDFIENTVAKDCSKEDGIIVSKFDVEDGFKIVKVYK